MIRLWQPETADSSSSSLRGRIEHMQSGAVVRVTSLDDVTAFIQERLGAVLPAEDENQGND